MNQFDKNDPIENLLKEAADQVNPHTMFVTELEKNLKDAHRPRSSFSFPSFNGFMPALGSIVLLIAIGFLMTWVFRSLQPQIGASEDLFGEATPTPEPPVKTFDYMVQPNDTCSFLAEKFGVTVEEIVSLNGLTDSCIIFTDQRLRIPVNGNNTHTAEGVAYDWNGTVLYLNAPFPETPAEMKIYLAKDEVRATVEDANALAAQFGMSGEVYQIAHELGGISHYLVVDGNEYLLVFSDRYFTYYPSYADSVNITITGENPDAETLINQFMQVHGFNFDYKIEYSEFFSGYLVLPLTPDGFMLHHGHFSFGGMTFQFDQNGIVSVDASLLKYDEAAIAGVISAEQAFQRLLDPNTLYGSQMAGHSPLTHVDTWLRVRPLDESISYYGFLSSTGRSISGAAPLIRLDGYTVTGNISDISENMPNTFVEVTGKFHESDGVKTFELESWKIYDGYEEGYEGTINREGEQVFFTERFEGNKLMLADLPADLSLPAENMFIIGVTRGDVFEWKSISNGVQGGGGGGGGSAFFKLNLSGTPVPLPTPGPADETVTAAPLDGVRGIFTVNIHRQADGSQRTEYGFIVKNSDYEYASFMQLEGDSLQNLEAYHNRPVTIWGTPDHNDEEGVLVVKVDRYQIPFPDLQFQILRGTQRAAVFGNWEVVLFTAEDGTTYVELYPIGEPSSAIIAVEGDPVLEEVLIVPDESFGGYPAMRVFSSTMAINPETGLATEFTMTADQPYIIGAPGSQENPAPPNATIEKFELVYFTPDRRFLIPDPTSEPPYLQPVWRLSGHYSDGTEFEFLLQALKDEFLLPEREGM